MIYTYHCECGEARSVQRSIKEGPPAQVACVECGEFMARDWQADMPMLDTSGCRDHDFIPEKARVASNDGFGIGKRGATKREAAYQQHLQKRRSMLRDGGNRGTIKHTHSVPTELFHGKIRETGDKNYWNDPKNLAKHTSCKVSE